MFENSSRGGKRGCYGRQFLYTMRIDNISGADDDNELSALISGRLTIARVMRPRVMSGELSITTHLLVT